MSEPTCNPSINRDCPKCKKDSRNVRKKPYSIIDPDYFYSSCPHCSEMIVYLGSCISVSVIIASQLYIVCLHHVQCKKCDFRWWTRIRATYYCEDCDLVWDILNGPIPKANVEEIRKRCPNFVLELGDRKQLLLASRA